MTIYSSSRWPDDRRKSIRPLGRNPNIECEAKGPPSDDGGMGSRSLVIGAVWFALYVIAVLHTLTSAPPGSLSHRETARVIVTSFP